MEILVISVIILAALFVAAGFFVVLPYLVVWLHEKLLEMLHQR